MHASPSHPKPRSHARKHEKKHARSQSREHAQNPLLGNLWQAALFGALCGLLLVLPLIFAASALCLVSTDPAALALPAAIAVLLLSAIAAGGIAARRRPQMPMAAGTLGGLCFALVLFALSLLFRSKADATLSVPAALALRALPIPVSMLGGLLAKPRKTHKKRRNR